MEGPELQLYPFTSFFPVILIALISTLVFTPGAIKLARRMHLLDVPGSSLHKTHLAATPMAGGMVVAAGMAISAISFRWLSSFQVFGILLAGILLFAFGLWDDAKSLSASRKLGGQVLGGVILIASGTQVRLLPNETLNVALTLLWVLGVVNAFNFVDSMDGLAIGVSGIAAAFFMMVAVESSQPELSGLSAAILGACVGLYLYNVIPARVFLGDSGSQLLGLLMASIALAYNPVGLERLSSWFVPILVLGVPIFDAALVVISRLRGRRPIYKAGRDHTYHRLVRLGLEPSRAVIMMQTAAVIAGIVAFLALNSGVVIANAIFAGVVLAGMGLIVFFETRAAGI